MTDTTIEQAVTGTETVDTDITVPVTYLHYRKISAYGGIESRGGATLVIALFPEEFEDKNGVKKKCCAVGISACSNDDNFDRKKGIEIASDRLTNNKGLVFAEDEMEATLKSFVNLAHSFSYADKLSKSEIFLRSLITLYRLGCTATAENFDVSALDFISRELGMGGLG